MKLHFHGTFEKFAIILPLANMNVNNSTVIKKHQNKFVIYQVFEKKNISLVTLRSVSYF